MASEMAPASASGICASAWARHSKGAVSSRAAFVRALEVVAAWNCIESPFRDPHARRASFQAKHQLVPKMGLAPFQIFGEYQCRQTTDRSPVCRDTGPPSRRVFVFQGFRSLNRRESPAEGVGLFAIRVNVPGFVPYFMRAWRALRLLREKLGHRRWRLQRQGDVANDR